MKDFLKYTLATIVGIIVASMIIGFCCLMIIVGIASSAELETKVKENSVMMLDLSGSLSERAQDNPLSALMGNQTNELALDNILASIRKAEENDKIKGIYIQAGYLNSGYASLVEIREALKKFKKSGKFIIAYADSYTQGLYYLSSVADKVILNPQGSIEWKGLSVGTMFYKDLMEKVGVEMQIFKVGTFKSAVEPFISTQMSDANREQIAVFLNSIWDKMLTDISESRNISKDSLNSYADNLLMFEPAERDVEAGMADTLMYKQDVRSYLAGRMDLEDEDDLNIIGLSAMANVSSDVEKNDSGNEIVVYYLTGEIDNPGSYSGVNSGINSEEVVRDMRSLMEDDDVKAVVLRVNSPGGSAYGSEQMWYAISQLKKRKPVIVSMGDYAASGGYYLSCNADSIVAEPTTLTGSIGIFGMIPNAKKLADKVGVSVDYVNTNRNSSIGNLTRPMNSDEKSALQMSVNRGYQLFIKRCADGRGMSVEEIDKIGQGRVWTGATAQKIGLVDVLGGLDKAIAIASQKANVSEYTKVSMPALPGWFDSLFGSGPDNYVSAWMKGGKVGKVYETVKWVENLDKADKLQAIIPFTMDIE